jgi:hypothetical protein
VGIVMEVNPELIKASPPIEVTDEGIVMDVNPVQFATIP